MGVCPHDTTFFFIFSGILVGSFIGSLLYRLAQNEQEESDVVDDITLDDDVVGEEDDVIDSAEDTEDIVTDDIYDVVNDAVDDLFNETDIVKRSLSDIMAPIVKILVIDVIQRRSDVIGQEVDVINSAPNVKISLNKIKDSKISKGSPNNFFRKDDDACTSNPCMNGGNCTVTLAGFQSGFRCDCAQGYSGKVCTDCGGLLLNGDQCYYAVTGAFMNYSSAQDTCSRMFGGHLAYIKTNETHSAVTDYMTNIPGLFGYDLAWIGASYDPMKGGDEITWDDGDVTNIGSWWHPGFPHTGTRYRTATKMKFDVADRDNITFQGFVNWKEDRPNYPLCQFTF